MQKMFRRVLIIGSTAVAISFAVALANRLGVHDSAFTDVAAGAIAGVGSASLIMGLSRKHYNRVRLPANTLSTLAAFQNHVQELDTRVASLEQRAARDLESLQNRCRSLEETLIHQQIDLKNLTIQHTSYAQALFAFKRESGGLRDELKSGTEKRQHRSKTDSVRTATPNSLAPPRKLVLREQRLAMPESEHQAIPKYPTWLPGQGIPIKVVDIE